MLPASAERLDRMAAAVFSQATWRAARQLGLGRKALAERLGLTAEQALGLATGGYLLRPETPAGTTAARLIRLFVALEAQVGGDAVTRRAWMQNWNAHLRGVPRMLINTDAGLVKVVDYLEGMYARC